MALRFVPVFLLGLAFVAGMAPSPARAQAQDLYTVSAVHVDASAASPAEAFNTAIAQGRPRAWQTLYRRITRQVDWARQPSLDAAALVRLSRGYTIANERRSTTRYVADITYMFNPEAVTRLLQGANIAFTQTVARRILLVPMSPGFVIGPWSQALGAQHDSVVPFAMAIAADVPSLGKLDFDTASWGDVAAAAKRINANEAALVQSVYANGKVTVNIRRLGLGEVPAKSSVDVPLQQTLGTTYPAAAQAAIAAIEDLWKARTAINLNARGTLTADVRIGSVNQWGNIQTVLGAVDDVTGVQLVAMDLGYARLAISYIGSPDQLRDALNAKGLSLVNRAGRWTITGGNP